MKLLCSKLLTEDDMCLSNAKKIKNSSQGQRSRSNITNFQSLLAFLVGHIPTKLHTSTWPGSNCWVSLLGTGQNSPPGPPLLETELAALDKETVTEWHNTTKTHTRQSLYLEPVDFLLLTFYEHVKLADCIWTRQRQKHIILQSMQTKTGNKTKPSLRHSLVSYMEGFSKYNAQIKKTKNTLI